jgi:hypothetical protein
MRQRYCTKGISQYNKFHTCSAVTPPLLPIVCEVRPNDTCRPHQAVDLVFANSVAISIDGGIDGIPDCIWQARQKSRESL